MHATLPAGALAPIPLPPLLTLVDTFPLVGRSEAWTSLLDAWTAAATGARQVALVPGEAGAGKTRLLTEFARHVHTRGATVLFGTCSEEQTLPYQPFAEALDHVLGVVDPGTAIERFGASASELTRLVPQHAADLGLPLPVGHGDPDAERARLFGVVIGAVAELARERPLLVVIDDLHWARRPTIDLLSQLVHEQSLTNVLVVVSYRSAPADTGDALRSALPDLRRLPGVTRVPVTTFDLGGITDFVAAATGHDVGTELGEAVDVLARQTDGNVFLLVELWQHLVDSELVQRRDGRWSVAGPLIDVPSPEGVREVVAARLDRLDVDVRHVLETASVVGTTFDPVVVAAILGSPVATVLSTLDVAVQSRLVGEYGNCSYRFAHELIRRSVYDGLASAHRRRIHVAAAAALDDQSTDHVAEVAQHLVAAVPLADARDAVAAALRAAEAATEAVAYDDAARFLEMAMRVSPRDRAGLLLRVADAEIRAGDVARAKQHCLEAHELAQRTNDAVGRIAAALAYGEASWRDSRDAAAAAGLLRGVLPLADDETSRVRLQASLTRALALAGDSDAALVLGEDALASARSLDDRYARRLAFDAMSYVPWTPQRLDQQLADVRESAEAALDVGDLEWESHAVCKSLYGEILAGDLAAARATAERNHRLATSVGQPLFRVLDCQAHALLAVGEGRFRDAEALAAEADEMSRALSDDQSGGYGVQVFSIRREQGRLDEARPIVEAIARLGRAGSTWRPALAVMYAELGLHDEAVAEIDVLHADRLAAVPRDALWHGSLSYLADACAAVGHRKGAAVVYDELIAWRGLVVQVGHLLAANGAVDRYLGKLAALLGHDREAEIHFESALRLDASAGMPVWLAHTQLDYGLALLARDQPRGEDLLRSALTTADRLGMATVSASARSVLGEQPDEAPNTDVAGLTDRELVVLGLVAKGRSNREIGEHLHISQHTAANHVRAILMKTQCANRTEAAGWALRRNLDGQRAARSSSGRI